MVKLSKGTCASIIFKKKEAVTAAKGASTKLLSKGCE